MIATIIDLKRRVNFTSTLTIGTVENYHNLTSPRNSIEKNTQRPTKNTAQHLNTSIKVPQSWEPRLGSDSPANLLCHLEVFCY